MGKEVIKDVPCVFEKFRQLGKRVFFITNNSKVSRNDVAKKLNGLNIAAKKVSKILI